MGSPGAGYVGEGIGSGLAGYGLSMNPTLQTVNPINNLSGDQNAIAQQGINQQGITNQNMAGLQGLYNNQNQQLANIDQTQNQNLVTQLTNTDPGSLGSQLKGQYNNLGLLNSGAFNNGLASQFSNLAQQQGVAQQQQQLGQTSGLANVLNQGAQTQSGLGNLGLQQQFGLEGQQTNTDLAQNLAQFAQQTGLQQALIGGGAGAVGQAAGGGHK